MHHINLLTLTMGALAVAVPSTQIKVDSATRAESKGGYACGKCWVTDTEGIKFDMVSNGRCLNAFWPVDRYENDHCGYCQWWEARKCVGKSTYQSGNRGTHWIPASKSYKCWA